MRVVRKFDSYDSYVVYYNLHHHNVNELNVIDNPFTVFADAKMKSSDLKGAIISFFMSLRDDERLYSLFGKVLRSVKDGCYESQLHGCYWIVVPLSSGHWYIAVSVYKRSL